MAATDVRVIMPIGSPAGTSKLCKAIIDKHTLLGVASPLTGFVDMADFTAKATNANNLQTTGAQNADDAEAIMHMLEKHCGISKGQNKKSEGTLYWFVLRVRDFLLFKYAGAEEQLQQWGFNVVITSTGGHTYVRVDIPKHSAAALLGLATLINNRHIFLDVASPIPNTEIDMDVFNTLVTDGNTMLATHTAADGLAQSSHDQALQIWGYGQGQTSLTVGTLYNMLCMARNRLKFKYQGAEEQMTPWGYKVIKGSHQPGKKKGITVIARIEGDIALAGIASPDLNGVETQPTDIVTFLAELGTLRVYASAIAGEAPGPTTPFFDLQPGVAINKTIAQLIAELGLGEAKPFVNIQNIGAVAGHYKITIKIG